MKEQEARLLLGDEKYEDMIDLYDGSERKMGVGRRGSRLKGLRSRGCSQMCRQLYQAQERVISWHKNG